MHDDQDTPPSLEDVAQRMFDLLAETMDGSVPTDWQARRNAVFMDAKAVGLDTSWISDRLEMWA